MPKRNNKGQFTKRLIPWNKGLKKKTTKKCENCKNNFTVNVWDLEHNKHSGRFCSRKCTFKGQVGKKAANWKGGVIIDQFGYKQIFKPDHPFCNNGGYVREHRLVMEKHLGRYLTKDEIPHHINEIKDDNRIENLELMTRPEHGKHHIIERVKKGIQGFI